MQSSVPTVYSVMLQNALMYNRPHVIADNTTLNEKLGILAGTKPAADQRPIVGFAAIGNGGHTYAAGNDGIPYTELYQHDARQPCLFNQLPYVLREESNDLQPADRAKYGLRKPIVIGALTYIAYYLRRLDLSSVNISPVIRHVTGPGVYTDTPFVPTADLLSPTPTLLSTNGQNQVSADSVRAVSRVWAGLTEAETQEFINACVILYGDDKKAIISELAICSGVDKSITISTPQGSTNFLEVIGVQPMTFLSSNWAARFNQSFPRYVDMGANTPLYNVV